MFHILLFYIVYLGLFHLFGIAVLRETLTARQLALLALAAIVYSQQSV